MADYGEFEEMRDETQSEQASQTDVVVPTRVRMPREGEFIGMILQRLGGNRMEVLCTDGKTRNCRVPGRFKRSMWLRPNDIILVKPWPDDENKADIIFHYNAPAANQLRKRGLLKDLKREF